MNKLIIGLFGEKGGGKETFTQLLTKVLPNKKIAGIRTSLILKKTLLLWNLPDIRENYSTLVINMEQQFGPGALARANKKLIEEIDADIVVVDGIRREPEVELVKSFDPHILVYLTAEAKVRFERLKSRGEKINERNMSFAQFQAEEALATEQLITQMGQKADIKIVNNGQIAEFKQSVQKFAEEVLPQYF